MYILQIGPAQNSTNHAFLSWSSKTTTYMSRFYFTCCCTFDHKLKFEKPT